MNKDKYTFKFVKDWEDYKVGQTVESDYITSINLFVGKGSPRVWTHIEMSTMYGILERC